MAKLPKLCRDSKIAVKWHFRRLIPGKFSSLVRALRPQTQVRDVTYWAEVTVFTDRLQERNAGCGNTTLRRTRRCRQIRPGSERHIVQLIQAEEWLEEQKERYQDVETRMVIGWNVTSRVVAREESRAKWAGEWWEA